jgi:hypothetical protein
VLGWGLRELWVLRRERRKSGETRQGGDDAAS